MHSRLSFGICAAILTVSLSAPPAWAHHGWGGNSEEEFELTGTVETGVSLAGPHATMKIKAPTAKSGISHWLRPPRPSEQA